MNVYEIYEFFESRNIEYYLFKQNEEYHFLLQETKNFKFHILNKVIPFRNVKEIIVDDSCFNIVYNDKSSNELKSDKLATFYLSDFS